MFLGIISDIHGNTAALEKAFALATHVDQWVCLGDAINQFKFSNTVVALLKQKCSHTILGNHEEIFFGPHGGRARASHKNNMALMHWLGAQPEELRLTLSGIQFHLFHSTPWLPRGEYVHPSSPAFARFGHSSADVVLYGHTHQPVAARLGDTLVLNPGSVGEGRPVEHGYLLSFAVLSLPDLRAEIIEFSL